MSKCEWENSNWSPDVIKLKGIYNNSKPSDFDPLEIQSSIAPEFLLFFKNAAQLDALNRFHNEVFCGLITQAIK